MVPVLLKQHNLLKSPRTPALKSRQPQQPSLQERAKFTTRCISVNPFSPAIGANAPSAGPCRCSIPSARAGWSGAEQAAGSSLPHFFTAKVQNCLFICFSLPGAAKPSRINKTEPSQSTPLIRAPVLSAGPTRGWPSLQGHTAQPDRLPPAFNTSCPWLRRALETYTSKQQLTSSGGKTEPGK